MPVSRRPLTDKGVTKRREISRTAARLFAQRGFSETGMDDIADALDLSKPTLYYYVRSKDELLYLIHDELIDLLTQQLEDRVKSGLPPAVVLRAMIEDTVGVMESHPGHLRVFFEHFREMPKSKLTAAKLKRDRYFDLVQELVVAGVERGEFSAENPRLTTLAIFGMVNWSYQWYRPNGDLSPAEIADYLWTLLVGGLGAEGLVGDKRTSLPARRRFGFPQGRLRR